MDSDGWEVLLQEVIELTKEVQDLKVNIENVTYLRSQVASQLEDARRRLEEDERVSIPSVPPVSPANT